MFDSEKAYIGTRPCGCITFAMVDGFETKREIKAELKRQIKNGLTIEVTTVGEAKGRPNFLAPCTHGGQVDDPAAEADRLMAEEVG